MGKKLFEKPEIIVVAIPEYDILTKSGDTPDDPLSWIESDAE